MRLVVLLPLLREQRLLPSTLDYFRDLQRVWPATTVALVTTERERAERVHAAAKLDPLASALADGEPSARLISRFLGVLPRDRLFQLARTIRGRPVAACRTAVREAFAALPTTDQLAASLAVHAQAEGADVRHYHNPDPQASMPHQLNSAARHELARLTERGADLRSCYFAIYNADSRPDPATFPVLARTVANVEGANGARPEVLQQSALFTRNLAELGNGFPGAYLRGAALLQSRWSLAREIPALRRQARGAIAGSRWPWLGHCTGHGLFIRADMFAALGGLPTETMNEDLALGFLLSASGIPIHPVPALEWADSPETVRSVLRQKRQWFWSYIDYPAVSKLAAGRRAGTPVSRSLLVAQGLARGIAWLATSPAVGLTLLLPLVARRRCQAATAAGVALASYLVVPFALVLGELRRRGRPTAPGPATLLGGIAAYLTHSIGPWRCCASALRRMAGARYAHDKTER